MIIINLFVIALFSLAYSIQAPTVAGKDAPSKITIASNEEPGERLIVSGSVFGPDGKTPLSGVSVYVYHTDVKGLYTPETNDNRNPRLRGYMRTDAKGYYEFSTIKPAQYPNARVAAHIHYVVNASAYRERIFEIVFEGDQFLTDEIRRDASKEGSGYSIRKLEHDKQGVWRCRQDITLKQ